MQPFKDRHDSFADAAAELGLESWAVAAGQPAGVRRGQAADGGLALDDPRQATAVFAHNDAMAMGAVRALRDAGLDCPGDISVVGYNDVPMADCLDPPLTTIRLDGDEVGRQAAEAVLTAIRGLPLPAAGPRPRRAGRPRQRRPPPGRAEPAPRGRATAVHSRRRPDRRLGALVGLGAGGTGGAGGLVVEEAGDQAAEDHGHGEAVGLAPLLEALVLVGGEADRDALPGAAGLGAEGREGELVARVLAVDPVDRGLAGQQVGGGQAGASGTRPGGQPRLQHGFQEGVLLLGRERPDGLDHQPRQL